MSAPCILAANTIMMTLHATFTSQWLAQRLKPGRKRRKLGTHSVCVTAVQCKCTARAAKIAWWGAPHREHRQSNSFVWPLQMKTAKKYWEQSAVWYRMPEITKQTPPTRQLALILSLKDTRIRTPSQSLAADSTHTAPRQLNTECCCVQLCPLLNIRT